MINPEDYLDKLTSFGVEFFTGVPDSLLKEFCACISNKVPAENHIIAENEGGAGQLVQQDPDYPVTPPPKKRGRPKKTFM